MSFSNRGIYSEDFANAFEADCCGGGETPIGQSALHELRNQRNLAECLLLAQAGYCALSGDVSFCNQSGLRRMSQCTEGLVTSQWSYAGKWVMTD